MAGRAWSWYRSQLAANPVRTQAISSAVLWAAGDIIAQRVNSAMQDAEGAEGQGGVDLKRTAVCSLFGFGFVGPVGHFWYHGLDNFAKRRLSLSPNSTRFVLAKLIPDTLLAPIHLGLFFSLMGFTAGKSKEQVLADVKRDCIPAFITEWTVWPFLQTVNFRFVPVAHQLLFMNSLCLFDSAFLSWINKQEDAPWKQQLLGYLTSPSSQQPDQELTTATATATAATQAPQTESTTTTTIAR